MATDSMSVRFHPTAGALVAILAGCAVASPSPRAAPTSSPAPTEQASASASSAGGPVACADVFDATEGRVAMTTGRFGRSYGIATVNADGSDFAQIVEPGPERDQPHDGTEAPRWTPDGQVLFDSNRAGGPDDWHIFIVDANGADLVQLTGGDDGIEYNPVMSRDGSMLVYAKAVTTPDGPDPFRDAGIFISDADGGNERQLTTTPEGGVDEWPDLSPDGQRVVFTRGHVAESGLFIVNIDGTGLHRIIEGDFQAIRPRWSSDGQLIVIGSNGERFETESANVWVVAPDGTGLRQLTYESVPGQAYAPDWSPDGEHIVFVHTTRSGSTSLDVIGLDGSPTCTLYHGTSGAAGWDPDWGP